MNGTINSIITDVINRLHDVNGDDRIALLEEYGEWLFSDYPEITYVPLIVEAD